MKRLFLFITFLIALSFGAIFFIAIPKIEKDIETYLKDFGFKNITLNKTSIKPNGIVIDDIFLDKENFSKASNVQIHLFWPSYLLKNEIDAIEINKLSLSSVTKNLNHLFNIAKNFNIQKLSNLNTSSLLINNIIWDTATPQGALRFNGKFYLSRDNDKNNIEASLNAEQHQLTFTSQWSGFFDNKEVEIDGTFNQMSLNHLLLKTNRGAGWASYKTSNGSPTISGQFDAGSGKLFNIPANNISLVIGQEDDYYPIIFRAEASGINGVQFNMDFHYSTNIEKQLFSTSLDIKKPQDFFTYLEKNKLLNEKIEYSDLNDLETSIKMTYMPQKRFADGPFPFDTNIKNTNENLLKGTFLVYPNSLDIRGTVQSKESFMRFITSLLNINEKNISDDVMRIDSNLKLLLTASDN